MQASHRAFIAQGASVGPGSPLRLDDPGDPPTAAVAAELSRLAEANGRDPEGAARLATHKYSPALAKALGVVDGVRPTLGEVVVSMDGKTVETAGGEVTLDTAKVIGEGRDRRRQPNQDVIFDGMGLGAQLQHGLIRPSVAYFLLIAGLSLIVFEFFAISIGLVGTAGAIATIGACYGFSHLPVHWWAVGLLIFGLLGMSIDVQAGGRGPWTVIGAVSLVAGSIWLYGGSSRLDVPWWVILLVVFLTVLFFLLGLPGRRAGSVLHPHGGAGGHARPRWARPRWPSIPRASPWSTAPVGGPGSTGAPASTPGRPAGGEGATAWSSRSSPHLSRWRFLHVLSAPGS